MKLSEILAEIQGNVLTTEVDPAEIEITGAYISDLLSDVMGAAKPGQIWITIMRHLNVVAVASMSGISAVLFARGVVPDAPVIAKADSEGICLISSPLSGFEIAGRLWVMLNK